MDYILLMAKILPQLINSLSLYLQGSIHPRWLAGFLPSTVCHHTVCHYFFTFFISITATPIFVFKESLDFFRFVELHQTRLFLYMTGVMKFVYHLGKKIIEMYDP